MFLDPTRLRPAGQTNAPKPGWIEQDARLADVIDIFRAHIDLRLLAVVDGDRRPVGAILEIDIRGLLFNPFGHALMTNPSFGGSLGGLVRPCPEAEADCPLGELLDIYAAAGGGEGLILTRDGCYDSLLDSRDLVRLAADREVDSARARSARAERIGAAGRAFTKDVAELSEELTAVASNVERFAHQLAGRAVATGEDASSVAIAAVQMVNALNDIAARGRGLACALDGITAETAQAQQIRANARATVSSAGARVEALADTTTAIDGMLALINAVASRTKILAINASIEAARAGPAGLGFGVVASEVKSLAGQTAAAAHDIARNVDRIQADLGEVVDGHGGIQRAIAAIASMSDSIDASVGQQNEATHMISRHVDQSVHAGADISARAGQISDSASDLGREAAALETLSRTLAGSAARLHDRADAFVRCVADI